MRAKNGFYRRKMKKSSKNASSDGANPQKDGKPTKNQQKSNGLQQKSNEKTTKTNRIKKIRTEKTMLRNGRDGLYFGRF